MSEREQLQGWQERAAAVNRRDNEIVELKTRIASLIQQVEKLERIAEAAEKFLDGDTQPWRDSKLRAELRHALSGKEEG